MSEDEEVDTVLASRIQKLKLEPGKSQENPQLLTFRLGE